MDLGLRRQFFAEEIAAVANLKTPQLVEALASLPREQFLRPGPWLVRGEADFGGARTTADSEDQHVYHNYSIAIDAARQLFNGAPGIVAASIDALTLARGDRVLHVGAGLGYYSGLMAHVVGEPGRVVAVEVDAALASEARANLAAVPWVEVRLGDATGLAGDESFDAILVSAGVTHPQRTWLDALALGGRMILSLTATMPAMGPLGKGFSAVFTKTGKDTFSARVLAMTAIYSGWPLVVAPLANLALLAANPLYDRIVIGRVHPVSLWGGLFLVVLANFLAVVVSPNLAWQRFALWLAS